jgi:hypothetical protein
MAYIKLYIDTGEERSDPVYIELRVYAHNILNSKLS